jgi:transposase InsO family protein
VDAEVKAGLLGLVDDAVGAGWLLQAASDVVGVNRVRLWRWRRRLAQGEGLADGRPGPEVALHGIFPWERDEILTLFDQWGEVDGSHRKLAHRGSRLERVFVSESTVFRVLSDEGLTLPPRKRREPVGPRRPWPECVQYRPCQVWGHDFTAFRRAGRDALAVLDLVSRKWITTLVVPAGRGESEHVQAIYTRALEAEGLMAMIEARMVEPNNDEQLPILLAVSDNGPQMISSTTREFMASHALAIHTGRPEVPTDQAHIESLFSHVRGEWPHLLEIRDPAMLEAELEQVRVEYNTVRLHAGIGYVTPDDEHEQRGDAIRKARREGLQAARTARIVYRQTNTHDRT